MEYYDWLVIALLIIVFLIWFWVLRKLKLDIITNIDSLKKDVIVMTDVDCTAYSCQFNESGKCKSANIKLIRQYIAQIPNVEYCSSEKAKTQ